VVISFLPTFKGDINFFQFEPLSPEIFQIFQKAKAVIFPQSISPSLYFFAKTQGIPVFPEYTFRFLFPGKAGQILLLKTLKLPHPETIIIPRLCGIEENPYRRTLKLKYPFVLKGNWGDEGTEVFLIKNEEEFRDTLKIVKAWERSGRFGFLIQEYIKENFDARAVVIGKKVFIFFREGGFKKNIVQEGKVISCPKRGLKKKVKELIEALIRKTGFNLVAVDFLFKNGEPLINEFNFVFGRRLLGEKRYNYYLKKAIKEFLKELK
jgi:ribosomal protein S6--L-glutamate ligase